jgi:dTDP-4-dehydrorhamnose reductase
MRILVFGPAGQLGSDFVKVLARNEEECIPAPRQIVDVADASAVAALISKTRPDAVVNCSAFHDVAGCEENPKLAIAVNADSVDAMARACKAIGAKFMTVSTDYVFDGKKVEGYTEEDEARPLNRYGESKLAGERRALAANPKTFVVRTQSLFGVTGPRGKGLNFVDLMIKLSKEKSELKVDQCRMAPTYTVSLAENMLALLRTDAYGLFHMSCDGRTTWCEFAQRILELTGSKVPVLPVPNDFYPRKFVRPENTYLINSRLKARGLDRMPHWESALKDYLQVKGYAT